MIFPVHYPPELYDEANREVAEAAERPWEADTVRQGRGIASKGLGILEEGCGGAGR